LLLITPLLRLLTGKPIIYDIHEVYPDFIKVKDYMPAWIRYPLAWIFHWLEPLLARMQSGLIFSDDAIAETFKNIHLPKATLFNYPGLMFVQDGIKATHDIESRPPVVLHLGGHERNRGTRLMIESFHQVFQTIPDARLLLVGHFMPPTLQDEVQDDIDQRGIGQAVTITGRVPFNTIGKYLQQASVGWVPWQAYPKNDKNVPTKLFEYMAYRVPIVSSDLNSTRPYVQNGYNGYLVTPDNPEAHAEAIINILQNPAFGAVMGKNGQDLVNTLYNWNREEEKLLHLYNQLLT